MLANLTTGFCFVLVHVVLSHETDAWSISFDEALLPFCRLFPPFLFGESMVRGVRHGPRIGAVRLLRVIVVPSNRAARH